jgi:hypothetical protein
LHCSIISGSIYAKAGRKFGIRARIFFARGIAIDQRPNGKLTRKSGRKVNAANVRVPKRRNGNGCELRKLAAAEEESVNDRRLLKPEIYPRMGANSVMVSSIIQIKYYP